MGDLDEEIVKWVQPYTWEFEMGAVEENKIQIRAHFLDTNNEPGVLRIDKYYIPCYIRLDKIVKGRAIDWDKKKAKAFYEKICAILDYRGVTDVASFKKHHFRWLKPSSGIVIDDDVEEEGEELLELIKNNEIGLDPFLIMYLRSTRDIGTLKSALRYPLQVRTQRLDFYAKGEVVMDEINAKDKFLTQKKLDHCQWIEIRGPASKIIPKKRISICKQEYSVSATQIKPLPEEEAKKLRTNPRIFSFDIECYTPNHNKFPDLWDPKCPIKNISCCCIRSDGSERKSYSIVWGDCPSSEKEDNIVICCKTEIDVILETCKLIQEYDPEVLTGFNLAFDIEYMNARLSTALVHWPNIGRLKDKSIIVKIEEWDSQAYKNMKFAHIIGMYGRWIHDVYLEVYRNEKFPQYNLNYVANHYLKVGKVPLTYKDMFRLLQIHEEGMKAGKGTEKYEEGMQAMAKVVKYCDEDSNLCARLYPHLKMWINATESSNIMCVNPYDLNTRGQQIRCYQMFYRECIKNNYWIDKRPITDIPFQGGKVQDPDSGVYDNVSIMDFNSLYPSIMRAHNVCYTTHVTKLLQRRIPEHALHVRQVDCSNSKAEDADEEDSDDERDDLKLEMRRYVSKAPPGIRIFTWIKAEFRKGLLPSMVAHLCNRRNDVKKEMAKAYGAGDFDYVNVLDKRQNAYKVAANSIYGFTGATKMPLREGAVAVTAWGRHYITSTSEFITDPNGWAANQIYGDTDSLMYQLPKFIKTSADCKYWAEKICKEVSDRFPDPIGMKHEYAGKMFCIKKKKYIIWVYDDDGKWKFVVKIENVIEGMLQDITEQIKEKYEVTIPEHMLPSFKEAIGRYVNTLASEMKICQGVLADDLSKIYNKSSKGRKIFLNYREADFLIVPYIYKSAKGLMSVRRDNNRWASETYDQLIDLIMAGADCHEALCFLKERIDLIMSGQVGHRELMVNKSVNAKYKNGNASMKLFVDRMRREYNKIIEPGERLYYIVVKGDPKDHLGNKMYLEDVYLQSKETDNPLEIDYLYYIQKTATKQVDDILQIAYRKKLQTYRSQIQFKYGRNNKSTTWIFTPCEMMVIMLQNGATTEDFQEMIDEYSNELV